MAAKKKSQSNRTSRRKAAAKFNRQLATKPRFDDGRKRGFSLGARERSEEGLSNKDAMYRFVITRYVATGEAPSVEEMADFGAHSLSVLRRWRRHWPALFDAGQVKVVTDKGQLVCRIPKASVGWKPTSQRAAKTADKKGAPLAEYLAAVKAVKKSK